LNLALKDLLGPRDYQIDFRILPLGEAFELRGHFTAEMALVCSRCAFDFNQKIQESFHELLVVTEELPRKGHLGKTNHTSEGITEGPFFNELRTPIFSISKFTHEIIALAEPIQPLGKENCDDSCENLKKALKEGWLKTHQVENESSDHPFASLENLKL
jgi:uncharacterized metal-binding protein YceD (DUF177 family)